MRMSLKIGKEGKREGGNQSYLEEQVLKGFVVEKLDADPVVDEDDLDHDVGACLFT